MVAKGNAISSLLVLVLWLPRTLLITKQLRPLTSFPRGGGLQLSIWSELWSRKRILTGAFTLVGFVGLCASPPATPSQSPQPSLAIPLCGLSHLSPGAEGCARESSEQAGRVAKGLKRCFWGVCLDREDAMEGLRSKGQTTVVTSVRPVPVCAESLHQFSLFSQTVGGWRSQQESPHSFEGVSEAKGERFRHYF